MMSSGMNLLFSVLLLCLLLTKTRGQTQQDEICRKLSIAKKIFVNQTELSYNDFTDIDIEDENTTLKFLSAFCRLQKTTVSFLSDLSNCRKERYTWDELHRLFLLDQSIGDQLNVMCDNQEDDKAVKVAAEYQSYAFDNHSICVNTESKKATILEDWMCSSNPHSRNSLLEGMRVMITPQNYCSEIRTYNDLVHSRHGINIVKNISNRIDSSFLDA